MTHAINLSTNKLYPIIVRKNKKKNIKFIRLEVKQTTSSIKYNIIYILH